MANKLELFCAALMVGFTAPNLFGQETNSSQRVRQLEQRLDELERKVRELEKEKAERAGSSNARGQPQSQPAGQKVEVGPPVSGSPATNNPPTLSTGPDGFDLASADRNFVLQFHGVLQVDSRAFLANSAQPGSDGFLLRRARPILSGTVFRDFDFLFVPDFGGSTSPQIFDALLNYKYSPALQIEGGKFKAPIGLEQLQADRDIVFNERALPTDLVPNRDIGFALHGDLLDGRINYTAGIFNGVGDARITSNGALEDNKAFDGRLFFQPFKKTGIPALQAFGFGLAGNYQALAGTSAGALPATTGGTLPGYATIGQQQFFAYNPTSNAVVVAQGEQWHLSPQGSYFFGPFELFGEYVLSDQQLKRTITGPFRSANLANTGWEVTAAWVLTGEHAKLDGGIDPRHVFNPAQGGWGAWQLVARYSELDIDPAAFPLFSNPATSARAAREWSVGLNWYLNHNIRVDTSFSHTSFEGGGGPGSSPIQILNRKDEEALFTRVQLAF